MKNLRIVYELFDYDTNELIKQFETAEEAKIYAIKEIARLAASAENIAFYIVEKITCF